MKSRLAIALVLASNLAAAQPSPVPTAPPCKDAPPSTPAAWERKKVNEAFSLALPACFLCIVAGHAVAIRRGALRRLADGLVGHRKQESNREASHENAGA